MRLFILLVSCLGLLAQVSSVGIKHVVVLMLENRAFDHMLGFMKNVNPDIDGCLPENPLCSNPVDPAKPEVFFTVNDKAVYQQVSPAHSIHATTDQIYPFGASNKTQAMSGFIKSYSNYFSDKDGSSIMQCFSPDHVPIISTLAKEFTVSDGWFASVPGPTMVNRAFASSATSHGMGTNSETTIAKGLPQKTMFRQLLEMGLDYRVYFQIVPSVAMFKDMRKRDARQRYHVLSRLFDDLKSGDMPEFSWVEPSYFDMPNMPSTDQHPDHDVSAGEQLIKDVYEAMRSSPIWESSALIITYDEHGGFFDHVVPPENVPNPDGINSEDDPFDFSRLGVRVPAVFVSPLVPKGQVLHAAPAGEPQLEHSSIPATVVHKLFKTHTPYRPTFLTERDAWARTFESVFSQRIARTDCPETLPEVPSHRTLFPGTLPPLDGQLPLSDLQKELILMVAALSTDPAAKAITEDSIASWTELEGAQFCEPRFRSFLESPIEF